MSVNAILLPNLALVLLTLLVWLELYRQRLREMAERQIAPQTLASAEAVRHVLQRTNASDNFRNLFELPVLFYAGTLTVFVTGLSDAFYVGLAWLFVSLRWAHSLIHITFNKVVLRFGVYMLGAVVLWIFWGRLALHMLAS